MSLWFFRFCYDFDLCLLLVLPHTKLNDNVRDKCSLKYILILAKNICTFIIMLLLIIS